MDAVAEVRAVPLRECPSETAFTLHRDDVKYYIVAGVACSKIR